MRRSGQKELTRGSIDESSPSNERIGVVRQYAKDLKIQQIELQDQLMNPYKKRNGGRNFEVEGQATGSEFFPKGSTQFSGVPVLPNQNV